ncbi:hypothetical protein ACQEVG_37410 [Streptomyces sp. CA-135486]|uniref:hypothetical protein n=1 Tax=Streptomyces sp. CA-135486 TaxID=3240049 RepID=UPI003D939CA2
MQGGQIVGEDAVHPGGQQVAAMVAHHGGELADVECGGVEFGADGPDLLDLGRVGLGEVLGASS